MLELDHIAVAGDTLESAVAQVEATLGVPLQPGGQHAVFATHNALLALAEGLYLEAIAIDPAASPLQSPRWFDLDRFAGPPRLTNWICRTEDLAAACATSPAVGQPVSLTRGDLRWEMAVPDTGVLPFDNQFPALIQWHSPHPAPRLTAQGCTLRRLVVCHPEAPQLAEQLTTDQAFGDPRVVFEPGAIGYRAEIDTPHGLRVLQ